MLGLSISWHVRNDNKYDYYLLANGHTHILLKAFIPWLTSRESCQFFIMKHFKQVEKLKK